MEPNDSSFFRWLQVIEKPFGYRRTTLNHIRLLYWFLGEFYYTRIFHRRFNIFWISYNVTNVTLFFSICLSYVFFSTSPVFTNLLLTGNMMMMGLYLGVLIPLTSYVSREHTFEAFQILDQTIDIPSHEDLYDGLPPEIQFVQHKKHSIDIAITLIIAQLCCIVCYIICTNLHLLLGYTKIKLNDPIMYFYPLHCEPVHSMFGFFIVLLLQLIAASPLMIVYLLMPSYLMLVAREFYLKFQLISDAITNHSKLFTYRYEELLNDCDCSQEDNEKERFLLQDSFLQNILNCAKIHEKLLKAISKLRPHMELNMSISIIMFMYLEVVLFYIFVLVNDESVILKMKNMIYAMIICTIFFVCCLTGSLFTNMEDLFRETVYDIPWHYLTPSKRKFVFFLLYRTHVKVLFKALHVYPMSMELYLRFCRYVYSVVNILRRVTIMYQK